MQKKNNEAKFYKLLSDVFVGAEVKGTGGFINLMKIKTNYYRQIEKLLKEDVDKALKEHPDFRDELFNRLYDFFDRYFSQNGSIHFNETAFHNNIYERVYTDEKDVALFWKTKMLYYVKSDMLYHDMELEIEGYNVVFSCGKLNGKEANEKNNLIFSLQKITADGRIIFDVQRSQNGNTTKHDEISKELKKSDISITSTQLEKAFRIFKRQSEVDYFINKDAASFLKEQFKLWSYQYFWIGAEEWAAERVNQLQILRGIAFKLIDFVANFEDELARVWNKPKFARNSNYVITIDRISDPKLKKRLESSDGYKEQLKEWKDLGIDPKSPKAPIDTAYFKELELEIIGQFDSLDEELDGWLIKSENYQALNTIRLKFKGKVQCVYVDPPFNTGDDFDYLDKFRDSTWLSIMQDRLRLSHEFLSLDGNYFLHLDENANYLGKQLIKREFITGEISDIVFDTNATKDEEADLYAYKSFGKNFVLKTQTIFHIKHKDSKFFKLFKPNREKTNIQTVKWLDLIGLPLRETPQNLEDYEYFIEKWNDKGLSKEKVPIPDEEKIYPISDIWNDIYSFTQSEMRITENFSFPTQKPENLLRRVVQSCTEQREIVLDYFSGIGTTAAVSQKLNRRWIAVEMGEHYGNFYYDKGGQKKVGILGRMKLVLNGDSEFSLPNTDQKRSSHLTKDINWQGGGFFKYYSLEQYEESLGKTRYDDGDLFQQNEKSLYEQYVFLPDEKLLECLEIGTKSNEVKVDLTKLYDDIDLAETLSNLKGKRIKRITADKVIFADDTSINTKNPDPQIIKDLIWW